MLLALEIGGNIVHNGGMTAFWLWTVLAWTGLGGWGLPTSLQQVGLSHWQPQYAVYAAYSTSFGSLLGTRVNWVQPEKGLGFGLTLLKTQGGTYGGFDLRLQRSLWGGTWGLEIHYLRSIEGPGTPRGPFRP